MRDVDLGHVTADLLAMRAEHGDLAGDDLGLAEQVAAVGVARCQSQRALFP